MTPHEIQAIGIAQEGAPTRCRATGYMEGLGWLEAWGTSLIDALKAQQALAARRVVEAAEGEESEAMS